MAINKSAGIVGGKTDLFSGEFFVMPPAPEDLQAYVAKHFPDHKVTVAYEAGCRGYYASAL